MRLVGGVHRPYVCNMFLCTDNLVSWNNLSNAASSALPLLGKSTYRSMLILYNLAVTLCSTLYNLLRSKFGLSNISKN
jgi:hypothetical protein